MVDVVTVTKRLTFEAGHRVLGHQSGCQSCHGHSWKVYISAEAPKLDGLGMVVDFKFLKHSFGSWIDKYWDHGMLVNHEDTRLIEALETILKGDKYFILPFNPTSENLAIYLKDYVTPQLFVPAGVRISSVVIEETETCRAEV